MTRNSYHRSLVVAVLCSAISLAGLHFIQERQIDLIYSQMESSRRQFLIRQYSSLSACVTTSVLDECVMAELLRLEDEIERFEEASASDL